VNISGSFVLPFSGALFNNPSTGPFYSAALVSGLAAALNVAPREVSIAVLDTSTGRRLSAFSCQVQYSIRTDSTLAGALTSSILATASSGALRGALNNARASVATANSLPALVIPAGYLIVIAASGPPSPPLRPSPPLLRSPPPTLVPSSKGSFGLLPLLALLALLPIGALAYFLRRRVRHVAPKSYPPEHPPDSESAAVRSEKGKSRGARLRDAALAEAVAGQTTPVDASKRAKPRGSRQQPEFPPEDPPEAAMGESQAAPEDSARMRALRAKPRGSRARQVAEEGAAADDALQSL